MVYSTRRFVLCLTMCHFVLAFFSPFSIVITSLGEERANLNAFRTFVRFLLVWICRFSLPPGVLEGLRFVIVALPGLFSDLYFSLWWRIIATSFFYGLCFFIGKDTTIIGTLIIGILGLRWDLIRTVTKHIGNINLANVTDTNNAEFIDISRPISRQ